MFNGAIGFSQPLSSWEVSKVENFTSMFNGAVGFDQDLSMWTPVSATTFATFLTNVKLSTFNYNAILDSWSKQVLKTALTFDGGKSEYGGVSCVTNAQAGITGKNLLITTVNKGGKARTITDGDLDVSCGRPLILGMETTVNNQIVSVPVDTANFYRVDIDRGDGATTRFVGTPAVITGLSHTYATSGTYQVKVWGDFPRLYCGGTTHCAALRSVDQWGDIEWTSMANTFQGTSGLVIKATDTPNLSGVVSMQQMFDGAVNLTGNFSGWDTSKVTSMAYLFRNTAGFNRPLASWDVSNVTSMYQMLYGATSFNQPLS
jgi:surface protein